MAKMRFALDKGGPKRLELEWKGMWEDFVVILDGQQIGAFRNKGHLAEGQEFILEDGRCLKVWRPDTGKFCLPEVFLDGQLLLASGYSPKKLLSMVYQFIFMIAGLNIFVGLKGTLFNNPVKYLPAAGWPSLGAGLVFLVLGIFVMKKSLTALRIALGIYVVDSIAWFFFLQGFAWPIKIALLILRLGMILLLMQGLQVIPALKRMQSEHVE